MKILAVESEESNLTSGAERFLLSQFFFNFNHYTDFLNFIERYRQISIERDFENLRDSNH